MEPKKLVEYGFFVGVFCAVVLASRRAAEHVPHRSR